MSITLTAQRQVSAAGLTLTEQRPISVDFTIAQDVSLPAAKSGTLSTRTDANTGTITGLTGHGITTGAIIDVYWVGGRRRDVVVGTVATNSIPIDNGAGDNLPAAATAVTFSRQTQLNIDFAGDDLQAIGTFLEAIGTIIFADGSDVELFAVLPRAGGVYQWETGSGVTNPLAGGTVASVFASQADSTGAKKIRIVAGFVN